ncbi:Gar1/Naf1 RNA binding region-domain-containing protein [Amanita rubescens]|nr:Gar1/Naf1 RNA binding region-domain-containing protein [Amanita rubescens]
MASGNFKAPDSIPQDLLLIHDLIGDTLQPSHNREAVQEDISSSGSDTDSLASEDEIEAELMKNPTEDDTKSSNVPPASSSHSGDSDSEESISDSDSRPGDVVKAAAILDESEDDEEGVQTQPSVLLHTKNELINVSINIPDIQKVGLEETMEKVGEVMSIVDNVVIVKALSSGVVNRGSDKALDTDTLLVFDDRTVLGYIYEPFGPTSQPLYQVRFNDAFPLDPEKVQVSREVFHVPSRSNFVFLREIKRLKGSDASNVHDEEPAEDELEFSDDEAEAAHRQRMKKKRSASRASSLQPSAAPQSYEDDVSNASTYIGTAFDAYGPYDADYGLAPRRPPPMPYDDPYADEYSNISPTTQATAEDTKDRETSYKNSSFPERGRARGRYKRGDTRARGRGRGQGGRASGSSRWSRQMNKEESIEPYNPNDPRPLTSGSSAHVAPGQNNFATPYASQPPHFQGSGFGSWPGFSQGQAFGFAAQGYQQQSTVQPHINPLFASAFGLNLYPSPYAQFPQQPQFQQPGQTWTDEWGMHMDNSSASNQNGNIDTSRQAE